MVLKNAMEYLKEKSKSHPVVVILVLSSVIGFCVGAFIYPHRQVAVESGQVLVGTVEYPKDNPFFNPPKEMLHKTIPENWGEKLWESRSIDEWKAIRREFGVTQVLTYGGWNLKLPKIMASDSILLSVPNRCREFVLFQVPE